MKKKEKKEETFIPEPILGNDIWLLSIITLLTTMKPKSESKTTINIYTGDDK